MSDQLSFSFASAAATSSMRPGLGEANCATAKPWPAISMADSWREMAKQGQSPVCQICGERIKWGAQDAFYSTFSKVSAHNKCLAKYGLRKLPVSGA